MQSLGHSLLPVPAIQRLYFALQGIQITVAQGILFNEGSGPCYTLTDSDKNRCLCVEFWLLSDIGNTGIVLHLQAAIIRLFESAQNLEQGRLAGTISANQAHALLCLK